MARPDEAEGQHTGAFKGATNAMLSAYNDDLSQFAMATAMGWLRKAAERGQHDLVYQLGCCLGTRLGITRDRRKAVIWYWKSADAGDGMAQIRLSYLGLRLMRG